MNFGLEGTAFVLSVGTAEPRKNLRRLLWAFDRSELWRDGVRLAVVGPTGWRFELTGAMTSMSDEAAAHVVGDAALDPLEGGVLALGAVAADQVEPLLLHVLEQFRDICRVVLQVAIEGGDDLAAGGVDAGEHRRALPGVLFKL